MNRIKSFVSSFTTIFVMLQVALLLFVSAQIATQFIRCVASFYFGNKFSNAVARFGFPLPTGK